MRFKLTKLLTFSISVLSMTSCQIYSPIFDCPPCEGVPCTSVTEIEGMIIESKEREDLFVGGNPEARALWKTMVANGATDSDRRIWVKETKDKHGNFIGGYYIYLPTCKEENK